MNRFIEGVKMEASEIKAGDLLKLSRDLEAFRGNRPCRIGGVSNWVLVEEANSKGVLVKVFGSNPKVYFVYFNEYNLGSIESAIVDPR